MGNGILTFLIALLVGGAVAAVCGIIIGIPALRLRGDYLAIVTLAFGEIVRNVIMNLPAAWFGGTLGLETPRFDRKYLFVIALAALIGCLAVTQNLIRSKHGRAIISIKDNEIAARAMGIDITKYKLFVFTVSAFFAGVAGVLYSYTVSRVQSATFDYNYSIEILVMVVLGGMGSINGSLIAAALITFINTKLQTVLTGNLAVLQNVVYALILITIVIYKNAPGLKGFREKYNLNALMAKLAKKKKEEADHE
jgi:branched-chain amino acid transport system permease protein